MNKKIIVAGTKRSGHHAIVRWIASQMPETVQHLNDLNCEKLLENKHVYNGGNKGDMYPGEDKFITLYSMEDVYLNMLQKISAHLDARIIIVVRDIRNTLASSIRSTQPKNLVRHLISLTSVWRTYAYDCIRNKDAAYYILFDKWFTREDYRRKICLDLNIPFTDDGLNTV